MRYYFLVDIAFRKLFKNPLQVKNMEKDQYRVGPPEKDSFKEGNSFSVNLDYTLYSLFSFPLEYIKQKSNQLRGHVAYEPKKLSKREFIREERKELGGIFN